MVKYVLSENLLTARTDDFSATVVDVKSYDKNYVIEQMLRRGSLLTKTDILAVLNSLEEVVADIIRDGGAINMPLFNTSFSISGVFDGVMDSFDPARHRLYINLNKGVLLRDVEKQVHPVKTEGTSPAPVVLEVRDVTSTTTNEKLTSGGVVQIFGNGLRIEGKDATIGLWFVNTNSSTAPVKAEHLVVNKPGTLFAIIPALPAGDYKIRIVTQFSGGGKLLKNPRTNTWERILKVD